MLDIVGNCTEEKSSEVKRLKLSEKVSNVMCSELE